MRVWRLIQLNESARNYRRLVTIHYANILGYVYFSFETE